MAYLLECVDADPPIFCPFDDRREHAFDGTKEQVSVKWGIIV